MGSSSKLGKRRCVEICELLETALEEAEGKAQKERMERLKMNANRPTVVETEIKTSSADMMDVDVPLPQEDYHDAAVSKEEEEYRLRALDYSSGHFAASVKEDKENKASSQGKNARGATSSLFNAILRSAQASGTDAFGNGAETTLLVSENANMGQEKEQVVEIIAHEGKSTSPEANMVESQEKNKVAPSQTVAVDSDEEEVAQLTTEFSAVPRDEMTDSKPTGVDADENLPEKPVEIKVHATSAMSSDEGQAEEKNTASVSKSKSVQEDDITDLSQALKKKKKSKKSKKKKIITA